MAGVTDRPFRQLCYELGSHWMVSEMVTSDMRLWDTRKSRHRLAHANEPSVSWVQLAGADSQMMADAAVANVELGAEIIDINITLIVTFDYHYFHSGHDRTGRVGAVR